MKLRVFLLVLALVSVGRAASLEVAAAASLTEPFRQIGDLYARKFGQKVSFNFGATNELRVQIENGAPADVFASASADEMDKAVAAKIVATPAPFARNRLIAIVPRDNPGRVAGLKDLARGGLKFVTAHPNVPVGKYTLAMLEKMGRDAAYGAAYRDGVMKNIVSLEPNVKQVIAKVVLGEADAGVSYVSDVAGKSADKIKTFEVPTIYNVDAIYPIAVTSGTKQPDAARRFVDLVRAPEGQAILAKFRFVAVAP